MMCSRRTIELKVVNRPEIYEQLVQQYVATNFVYLFCVHKFKTNNTSKIEIHSYQLLLCCSAILMRNSGKYMF